MKNPELSYTRVRVSLHPISAHEMLYTKARRRVEDRTGSVFEDSRGVVVGDSTENRGDGVMYRGVSNFITIRALNGSFLGLRASTLVQAEELVIPVDTTTENIQRFMLEGSSFGQAELMKVGRVAINEPGLFSGTRATAQGYLEGEQRGITLASFGVSEYINSPAFGNEEIGEMVTEVRRKAYTVQSEVDRIAGDQLWADIRRTYQDPSLQ